MNEKILKQMIDVVDSEMRSYKSDFYECDLKMLYRNEPNSFAWLVRGTGTSIMFLDREKSLKALKNNQMERFRFMNKRTFRFDWFSASSIYDPKVGVIVVDGELKRYVNLNEFLNEVKRMYLESVEGLDDVVREKFPDEVRFYGTKIPIHFLNDGERTKIAEMIKSDKSNLLDVIKRFRRYERLSADEEIVLWTEHWGDECGVRFSQVQNNRSIMTGGIWYNKDSKTWGSHT